MKLTKIIAPLPLLVVAMAVIVVPNALADLVGATPTAPTATVFPGNVTGDAPGTLLADLMEPWTFTTTAGTTDGTLTTAVYKESGGTLDFYYQIANNANSVSAIARESNTDFASQAMNISTGFRTDGGSLAGSGFVNGTVPPVTADLNSAGSVVGFSFQPPDNAKIGPGMTSDVFLIVTDATNYTSGNAELLDGGSVTVSAFQPASTVPEPNFLIGIAMGLIAMVGVRRLRART